MTSPPRPGEFIVRDKQIYFSLANFLWLLLLHESRYNIFFIMTTEQRTVCILIKKIQNATFHRTLSFIINAN